MAMNKPNLSQEITTGISQATPTAQTDGFSSGIIDGINTTGTASTGFQFGTVSGVNGTTIASLVEAAAGYPGSSSELTAFGDSIASHINTSAVVFYASSPYNANGTISGLSGATLANLVKSAAGYPSVSSELLGMCTAITDHINNNAVCNFGVIT